jgi:hypothetical protein
MEPSVSSRAVVGSLLAAIGVGPLLVDFVYKPTAKQHIHNPSWPRTRSSTTRSTSR